MRKFLDYERNPALFVLWSWGFWIYQGLEGAGLAGKNKKRR